MGSSLGGCRDSHATSSGEGSTAKLTRVAAGAALLITATGSPRRRQPPALSSSVDRFEVDGNVFGPLMAPSTTSTSSTARSHPTGPGALAPASSRRCRHLRESGTDLTIGSVAFDVSNIENEDDIKDGMGDAVLNSY
jgi:hypothetical protein